MRRDEDMIRAVRQLLNQNAKVTLGGLSSTVGASRERVEDLLDREGIEHRNGWVIGRFTSGRSPEWLRREKAD